MTTRLTTVTDLRHAIEECDPRAEMHLTDEIVREAHHRLDGCRYEEVTDEMVERLYRALVLEGGAECIGCAKANATHQTRRPYLTISGGFHNVRAFRAYPTKRMFGDYYLSPSQVRRIVAKTCGMSDCCCGGISRCDVDYSGLPDHGPGAVWDMSGVTQDGGWTIERVSR